MMLRRFRRFFSIEKVIFKTGSESVLEGDVKNWSVKVGQFVKEDDPLCIVEGDKGSLDVFSPFTGTIISQNFGPGSTVKVGQSLCEIDTDKIQSTAQQTQTEEVKTQPKQEKPQGQEQKAPQQSTQPKEHKQEKPKESQQEVKKEANQSLASTYQRTDSREKMKRMRKTIAANMKKAQNTTVSLTTFQQIDMGQYMDLRKQLQDEFAQTHGVKLGFMSIFFKACSLALQRQPIINSFIDGDEIVHRNYIDIACAVATPTGLVVPAIHNVQNLGFADIEKKLNDLAKRARDGKLSFEELQGGTFTISNGGIYGSIFGTPILNPGQSAILGMYSIENKPVVKGTDIVTRPLMNIVLTYDHRLIDGREASIFLKTVKKCVEDPIRILLDI